MFSPRVVVTLPNIIRQASTIGNNYAGVLSDFLLNKFKEKGVANPQEEVDNFFHRGGHDNFKYDSLGLVALPNNAGTPLRSNISSYGPWYAAGANGKLDFESDDSLVPWNYGGFTAMNNSADAKVDSAVSVQLISEAGSIEFPGTPTISLGSQLQSAGPYITDINVQIDNSRGVTTTYSMRTWTPQPYKLRKEEADAQTRTALKAQRNIGNTRDVVKRGAIQNSIINSKPTKPKSGPKQEKSNSTHNIITGEMVPRGTGDNYDVAIGIKPAYNVSAELKSKNWINKGGISLDGMFQPFSATPKIIVSGVNTSSWDLPSFVVPSGGTTPTVTDLNMYSRNSNYNAIIGGSEFRDISNNEAGGNFTDVRPIALRGPIIIAGPGYDTDGNPVPAASGGGFINDVNRRPDQWKVGPLDARWNESRGIWEAGSSVSSSGVSSLNKAVALSFIPAGAGNGSIQLLNDLGHTIPLPSGGIIADNFLGPPICAGSRLLVSKQATTNKFLIIISQFNSIELVNDIKCTGDTLTECKRVIFVPSAFGLQSCTSVT